MHEVLARADILAPLRLRKFRLLWAGMTVSLLGDGVTLVAIAWQVYQLSDAPTALGMTMMAMSVPQVLLLLLGGFVSDRFDRRRVMLCADALRAAALLGLGLLSISGVLALWHMAVIAAIYGAGSAFFGPAFDALVPELVPAEWLAEANSLRSFATMVFALVGLELAPLMGSDIRAPQRTIPRAIVAAGALIVSFYVLGTAALLVALPTERIGAITGIADAMLMLAALLGLPAAGPPMLLLMATASIGVLGAWVTASARLPYVVGIDRHLPAAFGRLHARWHTPHVALLLYGTATSALVLLALAGESVGDAYQILVDMTVVLTFLPIAGLFAPLPMLRRHDAAHGAVRPVPGGRVGLVLITAGGLCTTLAALVCALLPPADANPSVFQAKVLGGCVLFLAIGIALQRPAAPSLVDHAAAEGT